MIERIAAEQLGEYIKENGLGDVRPSAYKTHHSVETTLLALQSELLVVLDSGREAYLVLLDLSAAFDTVDHDLLLNILNKSYNVNGTALQWFSSYLKGRSFKVRMGTEYSTSKPLPMGVPQGSVLGPILFNMFSSGLRTIFRKYDVSSYSYADDTQFYVAFDPNSKTSETAARSLIQKLMEEISSWMEEHHLKLNAEKTVFLPISRRHDKTVDPLVLGNTPVSPSNKTRNLGFIFNRCLTIEDHINSVKQSSYFHLKRLNSLRHCISFSQREILTHAFITSRIDFCNSLFYGSNINSVKILRSILGAAARALTGANKQTHNASLFLKLHWLPITARIKYKLSIFGFKILHSQSPEYFTKITIFNPVRITRSAYAPLLTSASFNSNARSKSYGDRSCFYSICTVFNSLPAEIRAAATLSIFKRLLKTHLFSDVLNNA